MANSIAGDIQAAYMGRIKAPDHGPLKERAWKKFAKDTQSKPMKEIDAIRLESRLIGVLSTAQAFRWDGDLISNF